MFLLTPVDKVPLAPRDGDTEYYVCLNGEASPMEFVPPSVFSKTNCLEWLFLVSLLVVGFT